MNLSRLIQIVLAAATVLSNVLFGMGQRSILLSLLIAAIATFSLYYTDLLGRWVLSRRAALLIAIVATGVAVTRTRADVHVQLITLAMLQATLQALLLLSRKTPRITWLLLLLSLGQTIVASILNLGLTFGLMLLPYFCVGAAALAVLALIANERRAIGGPSQRSRRSRIGVDGNGSAIRPSGEVEPPIIELWGAAAPEPPRFWRGLARQLLLMSVSTMAVTAAVFFLLPRSDGENWDSGLAAPLRIVGFSPEVELGDLGEALESREVVMRVRFFDGRTSRPYAIKGEPLFRGTALTQYDNGRWERPFFDDQSPVVMFPRDPQQMPGAYVTQELTLEPLDSATVFPIFPSFSAERDTRLQQYPRGGEIVRPDQNSQAGSYRLATTSVRDHRLVDVVPTTEVVSPFGQAMLLLPFGVESELSEPVRPIETVAAQVLADAGIEPTNRIAAARRLCEHLRSTGGFQYSVAALDRDRSVDPLVDFVTRSRRGHCEYFAGALAIMLRSQGIPCRLAIGFKGGDWNAFGGYYQVMQLHAHAWVEAYLTPEECAGQPLEDEIRSAGGGWLVLDPTSDVGDQSSWLRRGVLGSMLATADFSQVLWARYVVGLDMRRQQESIYRPLRSAAQDFVKSVTDKRRWRARMRGDWFDWKSGVLAALGVGLVVFAARGAKRLARFVRPWIHKVAGPARRARSPSFALYRRLEQSLGRFGLCRLPGQTPQEFCAAALGALFVGDKATTALSRQWEMVSRSVIAEFYCARYGGQTPSADRLRELSRQIAELDAETLRWRRNGRSPS